MKSPNSNHTLTRHTHNSTSFGSEEILTELPIDHQKRRYPFSIVWTPIPLLTWLFPFIGHMGIAMSSGIIRDFAGPYFVSEDNMAFGCPTKYWQLRPHLARGGQNGWDHAVTQASEEYKTRMHNLCCDNCHSHVAMALNLMQYDGSTKWNMVKLAILMLAKGRYVSVAGFLKTWVPFILVVSTTAVIYTLL
ncbi:Transmembrane protein 222 [Cryptotermes secundus]|uniref:Transmembrane protein 222 n=1 Tax=Cryptotermes secundus TaxID=105785 RepID=A0A2J7R197_9NEOP|nr:transmembrane protein 222 isoform X2 [Cryptotermes secundus]PNF34607.1 Transmembrane protein 222 [Cryptotermes secundus]